MAIEQFDEAILTFANAYLELERALDKLPSFNRFHRRRALFSAYDILAFAPILRDVHVEVTQLLRKEQEEHTLLEREFPEFFGDNALNSLAVSPRAQEFWDRVFRGSKLTPFREYWLRYDPKRRLVIAYKGMFFFIRAYQDVMYAVLLELFRQRAGGWSSMADALATKNNPVGKLVDSSLPEYRKWFQDWRSKRNRIKEGIALGVVGPAENIGVAFAKFSDNDSQLADMTEIVRLADVVGAIEFSTLLVQTAMGKAENMAH